jgi:hypothetical protein
MSHTSFRRLALSGHQLSLLCGPDNLTGCLAEAKPIRQTRPSPLREEDRGLEQPRPFFLPYIHPSAWNRNSRKFRQ